MDGMAWPIHTFRKSHPRAAGCFARVLGMYTRDRGLLSLPQAIHKMTLMPANRIESAGCKAMKRKGRLQTGKCFFN